MSKKATLKECPYCAETINKEAVVCKHCHKELEEWTFPLLTRISFKVLRLLCIVFISFFPFITWVFFEGPTDSTERLGDKFGVALNTLLELLVFLFVLFMAGSIFKIPRTLMDASAGDIVSLSKEKRSLKKACRNYLYAGIFSVFAIALFGINRPSKTDHIEYLEHHTQYSQHEIIDYYETAIYTMSTVSSENEDIKYMGAFNRVFQYKIEK